jgi:integrase/recombinase XerD
MPAKLSTTISKIAVIPNAANAAIIVEFHRYLKEKGSSEAHQNNCLKTAMAFAEFLGNTRFYDINKEKVLLFLDTKEKSREEDPEQRWITTWNHYLRRIKLFARWLWDAKLKEGSKLADAPEYWQAPSFLKIREKRRKRLSPYSENDIWERDELLTVVKYETFKRNKAALTLFWDLDARNLSWNSYYTTYYARPA